METWAEPQCLSKVWGNLVLNDHKVAEDLKRVIKRELQDEVDAQPDG